MIFPRRRPPPALMPIATPCQAARCSARTTAPVLLRLGTTSVFVLACPRCALGLLALGWTAVEAR